MKKLNRCQLNTITKDNPNLIYRYTYLNDSGELRLVFRDGHFNHFELDTQGIIVEVDCSQK